MVALMITPVRPLFTRLIHISPSYCTSYCSFKFILEWELPIGNCPLDFKSNVLYKSIAS